ncbi:hypothetical protein C8R44DRAFT_692780 [Mycena epipterygia]|nr:hypothetical protein C8R44DRAFT_692780 [Mycena epipterygia]
MKLSILPLVAASAGLLASASPMRVVIVSSSVSNAGPVVHMHPNVATLTKSQGHTAPCGRLRQKATSFAESFKLALGFSMSSDKNDKTKEEVSALMHKQFKPLPFIGMPDHPVAVEGVTQGGDRLRIVGGPIRVHHHAQHQGHFHHKGEKTSFLMRVHFALMSLGPWEGRAVAFVLGCGIGVLLRMFWVMMVISYRMIKGPRPASEDEHEYTVIDIDAEEIFVAPPHYTYPVEKVAEAPAAVESN